MAVTKCFTLEQMKRDIGRSATARGGTLTTFKAEAFFTECQAERNLPSRALEISSLAAEPAAVVSFSGA
ncbi:MAG TPA: hypothetical protein VF605_05865 [Allosphingosinicella sp.]